MGKWGGGGGGALYFLGRQRVKGAMDEARVAWQRSSEGCSVAQRVQRSSEGCSLAQRVQLSSDRAAYLS